MTTAITTTNPIRRISAAGKNLHDADVEVRRIKAALHETETQLQELNHDAHVATLTAAVDAAITSQDAQAINDAARAFQEGRNQTDALGTSRMGRSGSSAHAAGRAGACPSRRGCCEPGSAPRA